MAAPICPVYTAEPASAAHSPAVEQELRAYKLGLRRWSYNLVELKLRDFGNDSAAARTAAVVHAAANGAQFAQAHQDSAVSFLLQLDNGAKVQADVYLCYANAQPCSSSAGSGGEEEEQFAWSLVTRQHCCKGCQGPVLRSIQRFGRVGSRQAKSAALQLPAGGSAAACGTRLDPSSGPKQSARKDPRFMYLSLDEACTHVNARAFRLVAGIYNRQGSRLLGTAVSPPIRVLANNDAPTGAARIVLEATLPSDWEGWSGGGGGGKRSLAAQPAPRKHKRPSSGLKRESVQQMAGLSMPSTPAAAPQHAQHMQGQLASSPALPAMVPAAPAEWQPVAGPVSPLPRSIARQPSLPAYPSSPLPLAGGSSLPGPAATAPAGELWTAKPPATLAAQPAPSLLLYSCSQAAAECEAERQLALLQQLKAHLAAAGSGSTGRAETGGLLPPCLPGFPLAAAGPTGLPTPGPLFALFPTGSLAATETVLSAACAAALEHASSVAGGGSGGIRAGSMAGAGSGGSRAGSVAGGGSKGSSIPDWAGCGRLSPPLPALGPGMGLDLGRECSLDEELNLGELNGLMGDFDCCGLDLSRGSTLDPMASIFDDLDLIF